MEVVPAISFFIFGTIIGSFLNVLIYRMPLEKSVIAPRSHCVHCKNMIPWYRNIPLVSFLIQRGKCASCNGTISWQYPLVESMTGIIWLLCFQVFNPLDALLTATFFSILIALAWIDIKIMMIPFSLILTGVLIITLSILAGILNWKSVLIGAATGALLPMFMMGLTFLMTRRQGMGWGDIQLGLILGAWLGPWYIMITLFLAALLGILVWIAVSILNGFDRDRPLPFAPYLVISATVMLFYGPSLSMLLNRFLLL